MGSIAQWLLRMVSWSIIRSLWSCFDSTESPDPPSRARQLPTAAYPTPNRTLKMPFQAEDVDLDADFDELIKCQWAAFEKPYQGFFHLICPIHGTDTNARDEAIKESTERQLLWSKGDPTGHWQKAVTDNDDKIVGGALWKVYGENPHAEPPPDIPIYWYPEGPQRDFAAASLGRLHIPLVQMSARPHICTFEPNQFSL